jgi:hypothetical protein
MLVKQIQPNVKIMKKASSKPRISAKRVVGSDRNGGTVAKRSRSKEPSTEMRSHYDLDYTRSRPNRFAGKLSGDTVAVVLDPDVANVFHSSESVNSFLRSAITAMPVTEHGKKKRSA